MTVKHSSFLYYTLLPQGYMFRHFRVIIRPSNEPIQDYLITSAFWDPVALTIGGVIVERVHASRTNCSVPPAVNATGSQSALVISRG
jgi:hypothetical protein